MIKQAILKEWNKYDRMNVQMDSHEEAERLAKAVSNCLFPKKRFVRTYRDEDCPECGFPETVTVRDKKTLRPVAFQCSKDCGYTEII